MKKFIVTILIAWSLVYMPAPGAQFPFSFFKVAAAGAPVFYYANTGPLGRATTTPLAAGTLFSQSTTMQWTPIVVTTGGTAIEFGLYESFGGSGNVKFGLYDASRARVAVTSAVAVTGSVYNVVTVSVAVTAQTYYLGWIADGGTMGFELDANFPAAEGRDAGGDTYAAGPPTTISANVNPPGGRTTAYVKVQ